MNQNIIYYSLILLVLLIFLNSCQPVLRKVYGLKKIKDESFTEQKEYLIKNNLDTNNLFTFNKLYLDSLKTSSYYLTYSDSSSGFTPMQFRMYNSKGELESGWGICFGNSDEIKLFQEFPPEKNPYLNSNLNFYKDISLILKNEGEIIKPEFYTENYDYIIVAFWAEYLGKHSRKMLIDLENYIAANNDKKIALLKVNWGNLSGKK